MDKVKELVDDRLSILQQCLQPHYDHGDPVDRQMNNEIQFLKKLLVEIERSK